MADKLSLLWIASSRVSRDFQDTVTHDYRCTYETKPTSITAAFNRAVAVGLPTRGSIYGGTSLYFDVATHRVSGESEFAYIWSVTWSQLPAGKEPDSYDENPLNRPIEWNIERREKDSPITTGRNVTALPRAAGGSERAANTSGPVVNAAGEPFDVVPMTTTSNPVLAGRKNFFDLAAVVALSETYQETTNGSPELGFATRKLAFLEVVLDGRREENGVVHWPGVIRIEASKSTDLTLDNQGWHDWRQPGGAGEYKLLRSQVTDDNGNKVDAAAPINLKLDGTAGTDAEPTSITYRHLTETNYSSLVS